jgi:hypothetical protein
MRNIFFILSIYGLLNIISCYEKQELSPEQSSSNLELREVGESCKPETLATGSCHYGQFVQNIQLVHYPGCNFIVRLNYDYCFGFGGVVALHLGNFEILDHDCPQFNSDVLAAIANNTIDKFWFDFNVEA